MEEVYKALVDELRAQSVRCYFQDPDQLVVSRQPAPAWPFAGNSFWVTRLHEHWYLCTWAPVCYRVPTDADLVALCVEFVDRGEYAQASLPADLVERYRLVELAAREADLLFGWEEDAEPS